MQTTRPIGSPPPPTVIDVRTTARRLAIFRKNLIAEGFSNDEACGIIGVVMSNTNFKDVVCYE